MNKSKKRKKSKNPNKSIKGKKNIEIIKNRTKKIYNTKDYKSGDGMLTSIWGPSLWHFLHNMNSGFPV